MLTFGTKGASTRGPGKKTPTYTQPWKLQEGKGYPEPLTSVPNSSTWKDFMSHPVSPWRKVLLLALHPPAFPLLLLT